MALQKEDYQKVYQMLDACNLSGIVHSFSHDILPKIWEEVHEKNQGTNYANQHFLCKLLVDKLLSLSGQASIEHYEELNQKKG